MILLLQESIAKMRISVNNKDTIHTYVRMYVPGIYVIGLLPERLYESIFIL